MSRLKAIADNPLNEFIVHGVKTVGSYDYILMVDEEGQTVIMRVAADQSTIKYCVMPKATGTFSEMGTVIDAFWVSPDDVAKVYKYLFQA